MFSEFVSYSVRIPIPFICTQSFYQITKSFCTEKQLMVINVLIIIYLFSLSYIFIFLSVYFQKLSNFRSYRPCGKTTFFCWNATWKNKKNTKLNDIFMQLFAISHNKNLSFIAASVSDEQQLQNDIIRQSSFASRVSTSMHNGFLLF